MSLDFQPGDVVRLQGTVANRYERDRFGPLLRICTDSGCNAFINAVDVSMVKRAVRRVKVGSRLTGREVCDHKWKRGTMLRNQAGDLLALNADAQWIPLGENYPDSFEFVDIIHDEWVAEAEYEVVFLP